MRRVELTLEGTCVPIEFVESEYLPWRVHLLVGDTVGAESFTAKHSFTYTHYVSGDPDLVGVAMAKLPHLEENTLVVFDLAVQPPPLMAIPFLSVLRSHLEKSNSCAIVMTHCAVTIQETPARCISLACRGRDGALYVDKPSFETFGASSGSIAEHVIEVDFRKSAWKKTLKAMADKGLTLREAEAAFGIDSLSPNARSFLAYHVYRRENPA